MAIFEKTIRNQNFDTLLRKLERAIPDSSWSAELEAGSDLDFSLHAFRLRADYFLLEPVTEAALRQGFCSWLDGKDRAEQRRPDRNEYNKENGL